MPSSPFHRLPTGIVMLVWRGSGSVNDTRGGLRFPEFGNHVAVQQVDHGLRGGSLTGPMAASNSMARRRSVPPGGTSSGHAPPSPSRTLHPRQSPPPPHLIKMQTAARSLQQTSVVSPRIPPPTAISVGHTQQRARQGHRAHCCGAAWRTTSLTLDHNLPTPSHHPTLDSQSP